MVDYNKEMFNSIESNQPHLFKQHVEAGAEINSRNSDNRTALHVSIFKRSDEISKEILSKLEPELGAKGKYEGTPLHMAAFMDDLYSAKKIIEILKAGEGISVIDQKDMNGNTAFHLACMYGRLEIAHLILKTIAPKSWTHPELDSIGKTSIGESEEGEEEEAVEPPEAVRKLLNARTNTASTPLHISAVNCRNLVTEYLLKIGADPQAKDEEDTPPQLYIPGNVESYFKVPAYVRCANCNESLKLDGEEQRSGMYFCPYCEQEVDHLKGQNEESAWFSDAVGKEKQNNLYKDETKEPVEEEKSETEEPPSSDKEPADEPAEPVVESKQREGVINCEKCSTPLQLEQDEIEAGEYYCPYCMQVSKLP